MFDGEGSARRAAQGARAEGRQRAGHRPAASDSAIAASLAAGGVARLGVFDPHAPAATDSRGASPSTIPN